MKTVWVLGAGFTGQAVVSELVRRGDRVLATSRTAEGAAALTALGAEGVVWQAPDPLADIHADAAIVLFPPRGLDPALVAACLAAVPRLVYCSSTSVYGNQGGEEVTEETPTAPESPWSVARVEAEDALRIVGAMIVRAAGIYGPGRNILERHAAGQLRHAGDPERPVNLIHVDDLAGLLIACVDQGRPGQVYLGATGRPVPWSALAEVAVQRVGRPLPAYEPVPQDPNVAMFYRESKRCFPTRFAELGFALRYPDTLAVLRELPIP